MAKLRILQGLYVPSLGRVLNVNDEIEISNDKLTEILVKSGYGDVLIEAKPEKKDPKPPKKEVKPSKKEVKANA